MLYYPDYCGTPSEEQAWGEKQFSWLIETLKASDAYFKIIVSLCGRATDAMVQSSA